MVEQEDGKKCRISQKVWTAAHRPVNEEKRKEKESEKIRNVGPTKKYEQQQFEVWAQPPTNHLPRSCKSNPCRYPNIGINITIIITNIITITISIKYHHYHYAGRTSLTLPIWMYNFYIGCDRS